MIIVLLLSVVLVMVIWWSVYFHMWDKDLSVTFAFGQSYVYAGEQAQLMEVVENRKKLPVSPVEVRFQVKKGIQFEETDNTSVSDYVYKRDIFSLLGKQRITRNISVKCKKRGCYKVGEASLVTYSILHERKYWKSQATEAQLYVYAKRTDVSEILLACENLLGELESNRKYIEDPFMFSSIRNYTMQEPMKMINWKASAKTGEWMVNTYTSVKNERIMIYLDVEDSGILKRENLKEDSISVAATLFQKMLAKGTEVGICINLQDESGTDIFYLEPSRQKGQRTILEQKLADGWTEKEIVDFEKMLEHPFGDAIPVIISKNFSEERVRKAEKWIGKSAKGIWVVPFEEGEWTNVSSEQFLLVKREVNR